MKRFIVICISLCALLLSAPVIQAQTSDTIDNAQALRAQTYSDTLDGVFNNLHSRTQVQWAEVAITPDDSQVVFKDITVTYTGQLSKIEGESGKPEVETLVAATPYKVHIDELVLDKPNMDLGLNYGIQPLAERIVAKGITVNNDDWNSELTVKEYSLLNLEGPWKAILDMRGQEVDSKTLVDNLLQIQARAAEVKDLALIAPTTEGDDGVRIATIQASKVGPFNADKLLISNVEIIFAYRHEGVAIKTIDADYDLRELALVLAATPQGSELKPDWYVGHKFHSNTIFSQIKGQTPVPWSIDEVTINYVSDKNLKSEVAMRNLKVENKAMAQDSDLQDLAQMLKGKPLLVSMNVLSELNANDFAPTAMEFIAENLADFRFSAMLAGNPNVNPDVISDLDDVTKLMSANMFMENMLIRDLDTQYVDRGLIDGIVEMAARQQNQKPEQIRQGFIMMLDLMSQQQTGFTKELMGAVKSLVNKPGSLAISITPNTPITLDAMVQALGETPVSGINYKINVK